LSRLPLAWEGAALFLTALTLARWFAGWPAALPPALPLAGLLLATVGRLWAGGRPHLPRPRPETLLCLALALLYRLPALLHPWGWVNRDGAYGAFVALHLLQGENPAPVFTEGANYQGTLKAHLAAALALLTGARDLSWLMTTASLLLTLLFITSTMALARRISGPGAALATGLYLALGPRFLTVFGLNCVGQYADVLALGGAALALLARLLDQGAQGAAARGHYLTVGFLLGAAFWQQPVALSYVVPAGVALLGRRRTWKDPWAILVLLGLALGALPVLLWNAQHDWASGDVMGRDPSELRSQAEALPVLWQRTFSIAFPILAGLSPRHPWAGRWVVEWAAALFIPAALLFFAALHGRAALRSLRRGEPLPALLPPLLLLASLSFFWAVASGRVYWRPRYLLPVMAATAVHLGALAAWVWQRSRVLAALLLASLLALNVSGTLPRLRESAAIEEYYRGLVRSLEEKLVRTGYADFSLSAPVTMFTAERILLSSRLGPTPAYESERHTRRVEEEGPDAFVLRPQDDPDAFAALLASRGVSFRFERDPVPVFYALSRRVRIEELAGFRGPDAKPPSGEE